MKLYDLNSALNFGQYRDKILRDVAKENAKYIEWCIMNVEFFVISESTANQIKSIYPRFLISKPANDERLKKFELWKRYVLEEKRSASASARSFDEAYSSSRENEYLNEDYNDALDTDQQSPEWWDSL